MTNDEKQIPRKLTHSQSETAFDDTFYNPQNIKHKPQNENAKCKNRKKKKKSHQNINNNDR